MHIEARNDQCGEGKYLAPHVHYDLQGTGIPTSDGGRCR